MAMRPDSVLVKMSRAGLNVPGALLKALEADHISRAALDFFPAGAVVDPANPLISHPRITTPPHVGFITADELDRPFGNVFALVNGFAAGQPVHVINSAVWPSDRRRV